jgi:hypothetical protein
MDISRAQKTLDKHHKYKKYLDKCCYCRCPADDLDSSEILLFPSEQVLVRCCQKCMKENVQIKPSSVAASSDSENIAP